MLYDKPVKHMGEGKYLCKMNWKKYCVIEKNLANDRWSNDKNHNYQKFMFKELKKKKINTCFHDC